MGAETLAIAALATSVVGTGASVGASLHGNRQQKKAARSAAAAADKVARRAVAQEVQPVAKVQEVSVQEGAERAVQQRVARRFSMDDTVQRFAANGLKKTLN